MQLAALALAFLNHLFDRSVAPPNEAHRFIDASPTPQLSDSPPLVQAGVVLDPLGRPGQQLFRRARGLPRGAGQSSDGATGSRQRVLDERTRSRRHLRLGRSFQGFFSLALRCDTTAIRPAAYPGARPVSGRRQTGGAAGCTLREGGCRGSAAGSMRHSALPRLLRDPASAIPYPQSTRPHFCLARHRIPSLRGAEHDAGAAREEVRTDAPKIPGRPESKGSGAILRVDPRAESVVVTRGRRRRSASPLRTDRPSSGRARPRAPRTAPTRSWCVATSAPAHSPRSSLMRRNTFCISAVMCR